MSVDADLFTGSCPFRDLPDSGNPAKLLSRLQVSRGIFTSFASLFHKDWLEGLRHDYKAAGQVGHRVFFHVMVNPSWPGWRKDLEKALSWKGMVSIKIFPALHQYSLPSACVRELAALAADRNIPLVLMRRLVDDRLIPVWMKLRHPSLDRFRAFLDQHRKGRLIMSQFLSREVDGCLDEIRGRKDVFVEIGALTPICFWYDDLSRKLPVTQWLYGSGAPLQYHSSGRLAINEARLGSSVKQRIFGENARRCYAI